MTEAEARDAGSKDAVLVLHRDANRNATLLRRLTEERFYAENYWILLDTR